MVVRRHQFGQTPGPLSFTQTGASQRLPHNQTPRHDVKRSCSSAPIPVTLQAQRHAVTNVLILAATSTAQDAVSTKIVLKQCELAFGETVRVVGDSDAFGNWSHDNGPELTWHEGHNWETELELAPGTSTFKVFLSDLTRCCTAVSHLTPSLCMTVRPEKGNP